MNPVTLLLSDPSPLLRLRVLEELIPDPDEREIRWLRGQIPRDPLVDELLARQREDGTWNDPPTSWALLRLGTLGADSSELVRAAMEAGADAIARAQLPDGSWPLPTTTVDDGGGKQRYDMVPLQTALPLIGLAAAGHSESSQADRAYEWLLDRRLADGCWPTGTADGVSGYVAGYRRIAHSRWGCRSNTTAAALALSLHPRHRTSEAFVQAVDHLLARETRDRNLLGFETARLMGFAPVRGFFTRFARFDPSLVLELAAAAGFGREDARVADLADWIEGSRDENGLWEYPPDPNASRWVSFRLVHVLGRIAENEGGPISSQPRTPFVAYPRKPDRF